MKASIIFMLLLTGLLSAVQAQTPTLPQAQKSNAPITPGPKLENNPKLIKATEIYNRLVAARGDNRNPVPPFVMRKQEKAVAFINYDPLEITLEEKAYDVCNELGGDAANAALAFLIGHELTHHYEKHAWRSGFAYNFKDLPIGLKLDSLMDDVAHETEADYLGGFLAYSAGYGLFDRGAEVIAKLYKAYGFADKLLGYPSLSDRQAISKRTATNLENLIHVFEMANLLTATGNYAEANEYYKYVLLRYQSREIYNNVGVTIVLDALNYFPNNEIKYRYPITLDLESSASKGSGAAIDPREMLRKALLQFDAAISLDPDYAPAYLNKACTYALLGDTLRARFYAQTEAQSVALKNDKYAKVASDVDVLLGILAATGNDTAQAKKIFEAASAGKSKALAQINLKILNGVALGEEKAPVPGLKKEKIDDQSMVDITSPEDGILKRDDKRTITLNKNLIFFQNPVQGANSQVYFSQNDGTETTTFFQMTKPGLTAKTFAGKTARGIGLGADLAAIKEKYGEPKCIVETPNGQILRYKNILFIVAGGKLKQWINYSEETM